MLGNKNALGCFLFYVSVICTTFYVYRKWNATSRPIWYSISDTVSLENDDRRTKVDLTDHEKSPVRIFLHLPKASGSLVRRVLEQWCAHNNKKCFAAYSGQMAGFVRNIRALTPTERNNIDMIFGHIPFGIHDFLNLKRPVEYFTILRDPVKQAVSAFHYMRYRDHYLGGAFSLKAAINQFEEILNSKKHHDSATGIVDFKRKRNRVIGLLNKKAGAFENAKLCFAGFGGPDGWSQVHNLSSSRLRSMSNSTILKFARRAVNKAWKANCTVTLSPLLTMSFSEFLEVDWNWNSSWKTKRPSWNFGNNPATSTLCCYHLWLSSDSVEVDKKLLGKCPHVRNKETLKCALDNMKKIDLILITEEMNLSLRLLEVFLNWTIPTIYKETRINEAVYVTPVPPPITPEDLILAEKRANLDRIIYLTGVGKFWESIHTSNLSLTFT